MIEAGVADLSALEIRPVVGQPSEELWDNTLLVSLASQPTSNLLALVQMHAFSLGRRAGNTSRTAINNDAQRFEPCSLDSESRVLTVTPRGRLAGHPCKVSCGTGARTPDHAPRMQLQKIAARPHPDKWEICVLDVMLLKPPQILCQ